MATLISGTYADRIERVVKRIEARLSEAAVPNLAELAGVAALSPYHFHRVYRLLTGETVTQTVQRLRVAAALGAIEEEGASVTVAAQRAGYSSSQSLARAVRARTGESITAMTRQGTGAAAAKKLRSPPNGDPRPPVSVQLVSLAPLRVVSQVATGPYDMLNLSYRRLFQRVLETVAPDCVLGVYGIPIDDPRDVEPADHRFRCCLQVDPDLANITGVETIEIGGGTFATTCHVGAYSDLPEHIDQLYLSLASSGSEFADRPTHVHYVDQPSDDGDAGASHISQIYVPVLA